MEQIFDNQLVRILKDNDDNVWFFLADVCKVLELSNPSEAVRNIDTVDISLTESMDKKGRKRNFLIVNESGLYCLIFKSRKADAKRFKRWVTSEVLPSIRKTGSYSITNELKKKSIDSRKAITQSWSECGVKDPSDFAKLTIEEYKQLRFSYGKRKKDFNKEEILLLSALESLESLNLYYNPACGFIECKSSLIGTASKVKAIE